jgi:plastocyanin
MRFYAFAFAASATVLGACGGGDNKAADSAAPAPAATDSAAAPATGATGTTTSATGTATAAPITGQTHEVKMIGDAQGYRFDPANVTLKAGDGIKFTMVSGGPHNVSFDPASVPDAVKAQLDANISEKMAELQSAMKMNPGESITVSFANIPAGTYNFNCTPHLAMGMKGSVTVQ